MPTVLIVDDDAALRRAVATALTDLGHDAAQAENGELALAWLSHHRADAVLLDLRMPGMDGLEVLRRIRARAYAPPVAVLTAVPTSDNTIEAMRLGAADYLTKPIGRDGLQRAAGSACCRARTRRAPCRRAGIRREGDLIGIERLPCARCKRRSGCWPTATRRCSLLGETGTGKELVARAHPSPRPAREGAVRRRSTAPPSRESCSRASCSATRAARSPAPISDRAGLFEQAHGGTLFLDEIGDMAPACRPSCCASLQERRGHARRRQRAHTGRRPRDRRDQPRSARRPCETGSFRQDLYYRLDVVPDRIAAAARAAARTSCRSRSISCALAARGRAPPNASHRTRIAAARRTPGRATCASS